MIVLKLQKRPKNERIFTRFSLFCHPNYHFMYKCVMQDTKARVTAMHSLKAAFLSKNLFSKPRTSLLVSRWTYLFSRYFSLLAHDSQRYRIAGSIESVYKPYILVRDQISPTFLSKICIFVMSCPRDFHATPTSFKFSQPYEQSRLERFELASSSAPSKIRNKSLLMVSQETWPKSGTDATIFFPKLSSKSFFSETTHSMFYVHCYRKPTICRALFASFT